MSPRRFIRGRTRGTTLLLAAGEDAALSVAESQALENKGRTLRLRRAAPLNMPFWVPSPALEICPSAPDPTWAWDLIPGWTGDCKVSRGCCSQMTRLPGHCGLNGLSPPGGPTSGACHPPPGPAARASVPAKPRQSRGVSGVVGAPQVPNAGRAAWDVV